MLKSCTALWAQVGMFLLACYVWLDNSCSAKESAVSFNITLALDLQIKIAQDSVQGSFFIGAFAALADD